jgi:DNA invertase Pin-like site-specific DNA recombinase
MALSDNHRIGPRFAAQYVRASTDMQKYSGENQKFAIAAYAARRRIQIVRTYNDEARSGLDIEGRPALRQLIEDIQSGEINFDLVLVYDVSRWGRFQNVDESAHYEYVCKRKGVSIAYCAEQFENDNSISTSLLKSIKRVMAGEYSRELSVKVFNGQSRIAAKGFHIGSPPKYALRRWLVDSKGLPKCELKPGERKNIHSDRTILVLGPSEEVETVRLIYGLLVDLRMRCKEIVTTLNNLNIPYLNDRPWSTNAVFSILRNEKYAGTNIYNRSSGKLGAPHKKTPPNQWVRAPNAFEAIVPLKRFWAAQRQLQLNQEVYSENYLLDCMSALWCKAGDLSRAILQNEIGPSARTYAARFHGLAKAYERIGFRKKRRNNYESNYEICEQVCEEIYANLWWHNATVNKLGDCRLLVNNEIVVQVGCGRTSPSAAADNKWRSCSIAVRRKEIFVIARVEEQGTRPFDYFLIPFLFFPRGTKLNVSGWRYNHLKRFQSTSLDPLYEICARVPL